MEKNTVCIDIELYNAMFDYAMQHEKLKDTRNNLSEQNRKLKKFLIESCIDEYRVRLYEMDRITNYRDEVYFAIKKDDVTALLNLGVGINEMIYYIKHKKQTLLKEEQDGNK